MSNVYATIKVRFYNSYNTLSKIEYIFYLDKKCGKIVEDNFIKNKLHNYFTIMNQNGYNYRQAKVIITYWEYGDMFKDKPKPEKPILFIKLISPCIQKEDCPFKEEVANMNISDVSDIYTQSCTNTYKNSSKKTNISKIDNQSLIDISLSSTSTLTNTIDTSDTHHINTGISTKGYVYFDDLNNEFKELNKKIDNVSESLNKFTESYNFNRKENRSMFDNLMKNLVIGKVSGETSLYGPAFKDAEGRLVSYDTNSKSWIDVTGMTFENFGFTYALPVAKKDIKVNDFILHNNNWARVVEINKNIKVEKIYEKEVVEVIPTKNLLGFDFYTKLVYFDLTGVTDNATEDNPFGNLLPLMLLSDNKSNDLLPLILMMQNNGSGAEFDLSNPIMMYALMNNEKTSNLDNMLPLMLMMNSFNSNTSKQKTE